MEIPFVDLTQQYQNISSEIDAVIRDVISSCSFIKGKHVSDFESMYRDSYGVKEFISVANGTDAIYIALKSLGIGPGDEVITVANSWISSSETISQTGATPVFVDIHPDYYTMDTSLLDSKIGPNTKAIIPVHLFGHAVDMDAVMAIAKAHGLFVVEDCAQAHFAQFNGQRVGTFGDVGTFSFFPGKNLGAYGDAGGIICNDPDLSRKMRMFANHGALVKHAHEIEGINSRMDGLQAAILSVKLPHLSKWTAQRQHNADLYYQKLSGISEIQVPQTDSRVAHVYHLYVIRAEKRDELRAFLQKKGVATGIHYPTPLPFLKAYERFGFLPSDFPVAHDYQLKILSLPMYPELSESQIDYVVDSIGEFYEK